MKQFEFEICQSKFYQAIICKLDKVSVCFVCINGFENIHLRKIQQKISQWSNDDKLLSVIGDFKTKSEKVSDISLKVVKICKKLKL